VLADLMLLKFVRDIRLTPAAMQHVLFQLILGCDIAFTPQLQSGDRFSFAFAVMLAIQGDTGRTWHGISSFGNGRDGTLNNSYGQKLPLRRRQLCELRT
jgi:hypothetical protein